MPLSSFHPVIASWFRKRFGRPTDVQAESWPAIRSGHDVLIAAPTGSGKTLAAFLSCIDGLFRQALAGALEDRTHVLYVSPLKALSNDVQKNLQQPLAEIAEAALAAGFLTPEVRVLVRTGDTPMWDRQQMLRRPPHILITTPESFFLLLTAEKSRKILKDVRTVIIDEIHAVVPNKRGAHLALSLERLDALTAVKPVRIGLSATQRPIQAVAQFLAGDRSMPTVIDVGHRRQMDLAVEVPKDELGGVATNAIWSDIYDRLAELVHQHRSTLVFVNTRRLVERVAHALEERLKDSLGADAVAAHHGSLSRQIRLSAEERFKRGQTRVVVATASLELGIDVGTVDLVCQIGSPRSIAVCLQRVGRSGHWVGAVPKGRLFATTRDELIECAALIRAIRRGLLDRLTIPPAPLDILAQQIVAAVAAHEWREDDLFALCRRAMPYRDLTRGDFDAVIAMLANGIATSRGRGRAYLHHDRINHRIRARRGARLAAITSGGAIPETANYAVVAEPDGTVVGSVDEDFAVESLAGDIILLGNASWRIRGIEMGKVRVEDAHGAPPTIPFWRGEAPSRTRDLSAEVAEVRAAIEDLLDSAGRHEGAATWLQQECRLDRRGADQAADYIKAGRALLGAVPTQETIIAERFFDEGGGMQLVLHAPFGGRINRAFGLALRKRFCVAFDFELQAAATDEGLVLSLGERHSFPLDTIFSFLHAKTVRDVLVQAVLQAPMFMTRWRWNATRALALLRFANGRRVPPQIQRMRAEDLLAAVFPAAAACQDNQAADMDRQVLDHPLVTETVRDCLTDAMDVDGLIDVLQRIESERIRCLAVETPMPSPFCHEILNANPYAYLDDAPLEERRARAVEMRRALPPDLVGKLGVLDPNAIAEVQAEAWPVVRDPDELHDALLTLVWVPQDAVPEWAPHVPALIESGRVAEVIVRSSREGARPMGTEPVLAGSGRVGDTAPGAGECDECEVRGWVATEQLPAAKAAFPGACMSGAAKDGIEQTREREEAIFSIVQGWMESTGPTTADELGGKLHLPATDVHSALLKLESQGQVLRGQFRDRGVTGVRGIQGSGVSSDLSNSTPYPSTTYPHTTEWCDRRLLARIHRLTIGTLRREIEPVTAADFMRFLFQWQHVAPAARLHGKAGLLEVIGQLAGFETSASAWERAILSTRVSKYDPDWLDQLCLGGAVMWGRVSPHPRLETGDGGEVSRITPTSLAPITLFPREDAAWLLSLFEGEGSWMNEQKALSHVARNVLRQLRGHGASFFADLVRGTGHLQSEVEEALWELAAAGLVTSDGFDSLRALLDPRRRRAEGRERLRRPRHTAGRWSLLRTGERPEADAERPPSVEAMAKQLLRRYGVVFRELLMRESLPLAWRDLLVHYRRMEFRGEVRGGRFITGFVGEQFALPEAVESLRAVRRAGSESAAHQEIKLSAADPLNLAGIILPGPRVPAVPTNYLVFRDGAVVSAGSFRRPRSPDERPRSAVRGA